MKTKKISQIILATLFIVISAAMLNYTSREKIYCGTVTNKINGIEYNKHSTSPDPILIVRFDVNKKKKEIHVSWITYTENEVGDEVCFSEHISEMEESIIDPGLIMLIACVIFFFGVFIFMSAAGIFKTSTDGY